ncbi:carbon-nitrogen hydrolase family protein [Fodinibius halophilus]|uniref:Carbon-nitrogen hydrolase family protein n=1 Tax=Fodinibius halophilus TaxID=1736908 RepID=A0A6M1T3W5_9BACT|nr:carbon-nitrogen hydrolase family protein [Fodinibius halophilus]NGP87915.1 carbon-nitrogen hydrolase family protein [Fodinibius halophilus]
MFSSSYKAAVIQMNSQTDLDANLEQAYDLVKEASKNGALVVGLPENFAFLGGLSMRMERADEIAERLPQFLSEIAKEFEIYLMGGSYPVPAEGGKVFNHSTLYGPDGTEKISYNKIHLFDVDLGDEESYRESDYVEPGMAEPTFYEDETIGGWGLTVCYDLRFPELYRALAGKSQVLSVPSAFTYTTGQDHWKVLLRARAIENTAYVFAPAQTGMHGPNRKTWGHAIIVDPWGEVIANAGTDIGVAYGQIDPDKLKHVRSNIPSLKHRRL